MKKNLAFPRLLAALLPLLLLAAALALPAPALADSIYDRVKQVSAEEQAELLENARIGVHLGGLTSVYAERDYPNADIQQFDNITDIAAALEAGRLDYALQPRCTAVLFMRSNPGYTYLSAGVYEFDNRFAVSKDRSDLREQIDAVLERFQEDGTIDAIHKKWYDDADYSMDDVPVREDGEVLTAAISSGSEPVMFIQDGEPAGCDIEIIMRVAYELGMRIQFYDTSFSGELAAVVSGKADVALGYAKTEERAKQVDFCENLYMQPWVAMCIDDEAAAPTFFETVASNFESTFVVEGRWKMIASGLGVTVTIALGAFVLATLGAALLSWMRSRGGAPSAAARAYVKIVTGIPVLVWLMLLYYVVFQGVDISAVVVAIICFGLEAAAPLSGIFTTGLESVDGGQVEASLALGFSRMDTFRRVVLPQAARSIWGLYAGQLTSLIKGTSIVGYVAIADLTKVSDIIRSRTFQAFFPLISTAVVYFVVIALFAWLLGLAGKRLDPKRRSEKRVLRGIERRQCAIMPH